MTAEELKKLIEGGEADRVEMTRSAQDTDKFREAICSFSNDMAGKGLPGYLLIGLDEKDPHYRLQITTTSETVRQTPECWYLRLILSTSFPV